MTPVTTPPEMLAMAIAPVAPVPPPLTVTLARRYSRSAGAGDRQRASARRVYAVAGRPDQVRGNHRSGNAVCVDGQSAIVDVDTVKRVLSISVRPFARGLQRAAVEIDGGRAAAAFINFPGGLGQCSPVEVERSRGTGDTNFKSMCCCWR